MVKSSLRQSTKQRKPLSEEPYFAKYLSKGDECYRGEQGHCSMI